MQPRRAAAARGDGDFVVTSQPPVAGFADYCADRLGLGSPAWLVPDENKASLATACWDDRKVRRQLVSAIRRGELAYLHPHMGNGPVWELAARLSSAGRRPLRVIGPPPAVALFANDKLVFARVMARLFGPSFVPRTTDACNLATLARRPQDLGARTEYLAIKVPDSGGGGGNYVVEKARGSGGDLSRPCGACCGACCATWTGKRPTNCSSAAGRRTCWREPLLRPALVAADRHGTAGDRGTVSAKHRRRGGRVCRNAAGRPEGQALPRTLPNGAGSSGGCFSGWDTSAAARSTWCSWGGAWPAAGSSYIECNGRWAGLRCR